MPANKNKTWIWFFVVLIVLAVAAAGINIGFNLKQQLKSEDLAAAQERWEKNGPASYDMTIKKNVTSAGGSTMSDVLEVKVRDKRIIDVRLNDRAVPPHAWVEHDVPAIFDWVETFLVNDRKPDAPRVFCVAQFDPVDGHLLRYVRSVRSTGQRQALDINLRKVD